jgi:hypothetical protein
MELAQSVCDGQWCAGVGAHNPRQMVNLDSFAAALLKLEYKPDSHKMVTRRNRAVLN